MLPVIVKMTDSVLRSIQITHCITLFKSTTMMGNSNASSSSTTTMTNVNSPELILSTVADELDECTVHVQWHYRAGWSGYAPCTQEFSDEIEKYWRAKNTDFELPLPVLQTSMRIQIPLGSWRGMETDTMNGRSCDLSRCVIMRLKHKPPVSPTLSSVSSSTSAAVPTSSPVSIPITTTTTTVSPNMSPVSSSSNTVSTRTVVQKPKKKNKKKNNRGRGKRGKRNAKPAAASTTSVSQTAAAADDMTDVDQNQFNGTTPSLEEMLPTINVVDSDEIKEQQQHPIDKCSICLDDEMVLKPEDIADLSGTTALVKTKCGHVFHRECLTASLKMSSSTCPMCKTILCAPRGKMPDGVMYIFRRDEDLPRDNTDPEGVGYFEIHCRMEGGYYKERLSDGTEETLRYQGVTKVSFLPAHRQGVNLLGCFMACFKARVLFTLGYSITNGHFGCVYGQIHHKSTNEAGSVYGWPDQTYLARTEIAMKDILNHSDGSAYAEYLE